MNLGAGVECINIDSASVPNTHICNTKESTIEEIDAEESTISRAKALGTTVIPDALALVPGAANFKSRYYTPTVPDLGHEVSLEWE